MRPHIRVLLSLGLLAAISGCRAAESTAGTRHADIPYATGADADPLRRLDITTPATTGTGRTVYVLIHGGGWRTGDKSGHGFGEPKTSWFASHDGVVVSINYRLSPAVTHPAHIDDVTRALAWVRAHAGDYGGDPDKLVLLGHSAGAHLAALAATDHDRLRLAGVPPETLRAVILLDGAGYDVPRQTRDAGPLLRSMYLGAFTKDEAVQRDASPTHKVRDDRRYPPFLIFHVPSRADSKRQADDLAAALNRAQSPALVIPAQPGESHMSLNRDFGNPDDPETRRVESELIRLGLMPAPLRP